jgi:general secretion pathway protein B
MSILLDALKRSESQRELGSVPTLQTSTDTFGLSGEDAPVWLSVVMMLLAAVLMAWLGLQQFQLPDGALEPTLVQETAESAAAGESETPAEVVSEDSSPAEKSILPTFTGAKVLNSDRANAEKAQAEAQQRAGRDVRNYVAPEQSALASAPAGEPNRDNAVRQAEVAKVEIGGREDLALTPEQRLAQQLAAPAADTAAYEYEPEIISYWQVPEAMREGLPDLRISVLVFAEQPESRFVLLNGERLREGEELPNGLLLEEIRRDRAIFNYRNYRFYLKG